MATDRQEQAGRTPSAIAELPKYDASRAFTGDHGGYQRNADDLPNRDNVSSWGANSSDTYAGVEPEPEPFNEEQLKEAALIELARECYTKSTDYLDANITNQWERNLSHFRNEHGPARPYRQTNYKRSRLFRPKTRTFVKAKEAALAVSLFSTTDLVVVQAADPSDEKMVTSAQINKALLEYRLQKKVPWFLTVVGAYQDTMNYGVCISHQYWDYEADVDYIPAMKTDPMTGMQSPETDAAGQPMGTKNVRVRRDTCCVDLIPPENFRFDPMADWRDPVRTSPYLIWLVPMYACDVMECMERVEEKTGQPRWKRYSLSQILSSRKQWDSRVRRAREGEDRADPVENQVGHKYSTVWAHLNVVRINGDDVAFWTLGTELLLTQPVLLSEMYPHLRTGERPFVLGFSTVEAHRNYPAGEVEQAAPLQEEINDTANQRMDNVKLVLNKRYIVRRGSQVDLDALIRNVPGGGVWTSDVDKDIKIMETRDVTGSSYQEQDRLSVELDDLVGGFSQTSGQAQQGLGQTKGGGELLQQTANGVSDYSITVFKETWIEPVLRQLLRLEQMYETDPTVLTLVAKEQQMMPEQITDELLQQDLTLNVDIAVGNTDPVNRVQRLIFAIGRTAELPGMADRLKGKKIADAIMGTLGWRNADAFVMTDEELQAKQEQEGPPPPPPEIEVKLKELEIRNKDNEMRDKRERAKMEMDYDLKLKDMALKYEMTQDDLMARLGIAREQNQTTRDKAALEAANRSAEMNMKRASDGPADGPPAKGPPSGAGEDR